MITRQPVIIVIPYTGKQATAAEVEQWKTLLNWKAGQRVLQAIVDRKKQEEANQKTA